MAIQQQYTTLNTKKLAIYLKKANKEKTIWTQRLDETMHVLTERNILVRVPLNGELSAWKSEHDCAMFLYDGSVHDYTPKHFVPSWFRFMEQFQETEHVHVLKPTSYLYETYSGVMYRRFDTEGEETRHTWIDRRITDLFGASPDELTRLIWEQYKGERIRVAGYNGWCAVVMPAVNIEW